MMKMNSIRFKITAIAVAAVLVAMLAVSAASLPTIQAETERSSVEMMRLIGENTKSTLDEYFVSVEQAVNLAANMAVDSLDSVTLVECGAAGTYARQNERTQEQTERLDAYIAGHCEKVLRRASSPTTTASIPRSAGRSTGFTIPGSGRRASWSRSRWTPRASTRRTPATTSGILRRSSAAAPPGSTCILTCRWGGCSFAPMWCRSTAPTR